MGFSSILRFFHVKKFGVCWFLPYLFYAFYYFAYYLFREDLIWVLLPRVYLLILISSQQLVSELRLGALICTLKMGDNEGAGTMIKLDSTNYSIWKSRMEDLLFCKDLYDPIEEKGVKPAAKSDGDWKKINRKTIGVIRQWIDQSIYHHVSGETLAYNLWKRLSELFESKNSLNKAFLIRKLVNLKYKDGSSVAEHLSSFQNMVNQLTTMEIVLDDELLALLLLSSLPDSW